MTHLFVGLGNPGEKYAKNRHNVGFMLLEYLVSQVTGSEDNNFKLDQKLDTRILSLSVKGSKYIFAEPQTYMNASGQSVGKILAYYKVAPENLTVIHDDLDFKIGDYKIQHASGPKQHNGVMSIEEALGTKNFNRVRIGIENRPEEIRISGEDYVLSNFNSEEKNMLHTEVFPRIFTDLGFSS